MALTKVTRATTLIKDGWGAFNTLIDDLLSVANGKGASQVGIYDSAGNMSATNVEDALAEVYTDHSTTKALAETFDENSATTTGLVWGYKGGLFRLDAVVTTVAAGTIALTDDATNYLEIDPDDGLVKKNTTAFTSLRIPIRTVVTASGVQTTSTDRRAWFAQIAGATVASAGIIELATDAEFITGTATDRTITPANAKLLTTKGGDLTSEDPLVIDTDGSYFDVTGTTNFASMTVAANRFFTLQFDGILTMTHHATNLDLPGGANITTASGDVGIFQSTGANTVQCISYTKVDGTSIVNASIATDVTWAAAGDLVQGTGNDTAAVLTAGTKGQVLQSGGAAAANTWVDKPNKNILINGSLAVWQRGTTLSQAFSGFATYIADRWKNYGNTTLLTVSRQTSGLDGSQYSMRVQRDAAETATTIIYTVNVMESRDSILLRGKHLTFSFWAKAGADFSAASNLLTATVQSGTGTDENSFSVWTGSTDIATVGATLTTGWQKFTCTTSVVVPNTVTQLNVRLHYTPVGTASTNDWFEFTQAQLETGQSATAFEYRDYGTELAMCRRYYERISKNIGSSGYGSGMCYSTTAAQAIVFYKSKKRSVPTVTTSSTPGDFQIRDISSIATSGFGTPIPDIESCTILITAASGLTAGAGCIFRNTSTNATYIDFDSEV
jgi:hypothetical protein